MCIVLDLGYVILYTFEKVKTRTYTYSSVGDHEVRDAGAQRSHATLIRPGKFQ